MKRKSHDTTLQMNTRCVHAGYETGAAEYGLNTPVVTSTAFDYTRDSEVRYPRYLNTPTHRVVAARIAALEGAEAAFVTASGMGAVSAVFFGLLRPGDHVILLKGLYGGTSDLCQGLLIPFGVEFSIWDGDPGTLAGLIRDETRLAWVDSPTNPLLRIIDLRRTAEVLRQHEVIAVIDNTFATPILQQPLLLGFDLVMHSGTKYLSGHSDLLCGALAGSAALIERARQQAVRLGSSLNGQDLALLDRSLKTLGLRVERQSANAEQIAQWLSGRDDIDAVYYPGLADDAGHATASRQMRACGGMLGFRLARDVDVERFLENLELITPAVSLGGVESTICQPSRTSHARLSDNERAALGIDDHLMRLSCGIEAADDLRADLDNGLNTA